MVTLVNVLIKMVSNQLRTQHWKEGRNCEEFFFFDTLFDTSIQLYFFFVWLVFDSSMSYFVRNAIFFLRITPPFQRIHMFLSSIDFRMILVWWFDSGVIVWLWCDGSEVVFVNVNVYKSKKLQRNVKQKID